MPELPEVETVCRQLAPVLVGKTLTQLEIRDEKLRQFDPRLLSHATLLEVERNGKEILLSFEKGSRMVFLSVHLRMTGRLIWNELDSNRLLYFEGAPDWTRFVRARFHFSDGVLHFSDVRRFGTFKLAHDRSSVQCPAVDPVRDDLTEALLERLLSRSAQAIKVWLMRQDQLVGIGNIYASEILFDSGIHPETPANTLTPGERSTLGQSIRKILNAAIENAGTTFSDFRDAKGEMGGYQQFLKVYDREGGECVRCGAPIQRIVQAQRSTFFCHQCQRRLESKSKTKRKSRQC